MHKYVFNTKGEYVAFIIDDKFCFSAENDYIGFFIKSHLYDYSGNYLGTLTSDDRIVKQKNINMPRVTPMNKPFKPFLPFSPFNRFSMSSLPSNYEDIFMDKHLKRNLEELDRKYSKYVNMKLYADDGTFLGRIDFDKYNADSLANNYGDYGSEYSDKSVFNKYGTYGSPYNSQSPFNEYTSTPPEIRDSDNNVIGKLSANRYISNNIDSIEFFKWFNYRLNK